MREELRQKAKKKVEAKVAFYVCTIIFAFTTVILILLSYQFPNIAFWLRLPILVFFMILGLIYLFAFGLPSTGPLTEDWRAEEIEREMVKLYWKKKAQLPPLEELSDKEILELEELERIKQKWDRKEGFV